MKYAIVRFLERACNITHPIVMHRPWLWIFASCPLSRLSFWLDERWGWTGAWEEVDNDSPYEYYAPSKTNQGDDKASIW